MEQSPFVVKVGDKEITQNHLTIFDSSGRLVRSESVITGEHQFNSEGLRGGIYIFELNNEAGTFREKVIIAK